MWLRHLPKRKSDADGAYVVASPTEMPYPKHFNGFANAHPGRVSRPFSYRQATPCA